MAAERRQRRRVLSAIAKEVRKGLPKRAKIESSVDPTVVLRAALALIGELELLKEFLASTLMVHVLDTPLASGPRPRGAAVKPTPEIAALAADAPTHRNSMQYYWNFRSGDRQVTLLQAETDTDGNVLRANLVVSA